jgi:nickel superoxide dismutase
MLEQLYLCFGKSLRAMASLLGILILALGSSNGVAHCHVPCGIYDDSDRVKSMLEDVMTIEKAVSEMQSIAEKSDPLSVNQKVRWVMNKELHAQRIIDTISDYFLTQRVKPAQKDYSKRLMDHHQVIVSAMKAKQSASLEPVKALREAVLVLAPYYPAPHKH